MTVILAFKRSNHNLTSEARARACHTVCILPAVCVTHGEAAWGPRSCPPAGGFVPWTTRLYCHQYAKSKHKDANAISHGPPTRTQPPYANGSCTKAHNEDRLSESCRLKSPKLQCDSLSESLHLGLWRGRRRWQPCSIRVALAATNEIPMQNLTISLQLCHAHGDFPINQADLI